MSGSPFEPYIYPKRPSRDSYHVTAGVKSRAKTAIAEARQWLVAVCWQSTLAGNALEVS